MTSIVLKQFDGVSPRTPPRYLADTQAQTALNCPAWLGSLTGLPDTTKVIDTIKPVVKAIYRFGQDINEDGRYWFEFARDTDVVRGAIAGDTEERTYWTDGVKPKKTNNVLALTGGTSYPVAAYDLGIPAPANACTAVVNGTGTGISETRVYTYVNVSSWGEPSQPADPSQTVNVMVGQSVNLNFLAVPGAGNYNIDKKWIYRLVTGNATSEYLFVAEIDVATTTFTDTVMAADLGEPIISVGYAAPPDSLQGLVALPNGGMAAFTGIDLYFAEPFRPYAWPAEYIQSMDYPIVGLGVMDTTVAVITKGVPYFAQGSSPDQVVMVKSDIHQGCVSKRSIVSMGQSVFYASPDGLVALSSAGSGLITDNMFSRALWQQLDIETLQAYQWENKYVAFFGSGGGFVYDPASKTFIFHDINAAAGYNDLQRDALYLVVGNEIATWFTGAPRPYVWRSKVFTSPKPAYFNCAKVLAESYPVTFKLYGDGQLIHTQVVSKREAFRLPGERYLDYEFEVSGEKEVFTVAIAQSIGELASV